MLSRKHFFVCGALVVISSVVRPANEQVTSRPDTQRTGSGGQNQQSISVRLHQMYPNLPPDQNPAAVSRGKRLFEANCGFCHGTDAAGGNSGPDLVRSVLVNHDENGNLIGPLIREGRVSKGMPKSNPTEAQISDIVAFLHQRNRDARLRFTYKIGNVAVGDAAAGKAYFEAHCSNCHSPRGDLAGIAEKYPGDQLQQQWIYPRPGPAPTVTVILASGQKYSGNLEHVDEFNVSLTDAQGNYHSFPITKETDVEVTDPLAAHYELLNHLSDTDMHNVTTFLESLK